MNQNVQDKASVINSAMSSEVGKLLWTVAKTIITLLITVLVTICTSYLGSISNKYDNQAAINTRQDLSLQSMQLLGQSQQKVQDAQATILNQTVQQVLHNTDSIEHLKDVQLQIIQRSRPQ